MRTIEIYSAIDPIYIEDRQVRYWGEFDGLRTNELTEWAPINHWAETLCAENPDAAIIDRSDKDSGYLRSVLRGERPYGH